MYTSHSYSDGTRSSLDAGDLDHPLQVGGVEALLDEPGGQGPPLVWRASVDGEAWLGVLVFALLQPVSHFLLEDTRQSINGETRGNPF